MSSGSESDDEYIPGEPERVSEEESADEETDLQYDREQEHKAKKRKTAQDRKGQKKIKVSNGKKEEDSDKEEKNEVALNPEEEKKREDDLWAKFLEGTDTKPKAVIDKKNSVTNLQTSTATTSKSVTAVNNDKSKVDDNKERERRIFEFAGETIVVENDVIKEKIKVTESTASASTDALPSRARGGGLANVLGQLNKKNKLSTLEKSKLDWTTYKKEEGIEEEIHSHNKGKDGYLDRQDFLERADLRQYEIERDMRMKRRSNR